MSETHWSRRTALRFIGATTAAAGLTSAVAAQEDEDTGDDANGEGTDRLPIILAGRIEYWYGVAPEAIEGEENPTLDLEEGEEYELVWINVDGVEHELVVESGDGEELEASEASETAGEAVSMTFEASEDAAEYYCQFHPESMRGDVELGDGFDLSANGSDEEGESEANESDDENDSGTDGDDSGGDDDSGGSDSGY
ncbi:plastocyanin/azurin family copper-binding protein [Halosolutus amylolyticus]|uniref:Plastocyanin/azurin family copper-binding protein n=1 Tax=Halosolutus amylolyticus TaxID=2932267 RepID=A0ABD5PMK3_9EURY|nr:plastocyanin/azurin family copper-binding protein [Halosolutus amylolyticus]